jgi:SPP1 gp7 family putative phage head morphogenesis protein
MNARAQYTAHQVRLFRSIGIAKKPRKRLPRQVPPKPLEREYAKQILVIIREVHAALAPLIAEVPQLIEAALRERRFDIRFDADKSKLRALANQARDVMKMNLTAVRLESLAQKYGQATSQFQKNQLAKQAKAALGVDLFMADRKVAVLLDGFVTANVTLISNLPEQIISGVESSIVNAVQKGMRSEDLAEELEKKFGMNEDRAAGIARDQIGTVYGQINAARQQELGITRFKWRTSRDERVRDEHEARERESEDNPYSYDDPPDGELPGEPINCRCYAEPVFDMLEEA